MSITNPKPKLKLKLKFSKKIRKTTMRGGRYLGQGAFGCVITPALQCNRNRSMKYSISPKRYSIPRDDVSKIISRTDDKDDTIDNEIAVANKLKHIDPYQKYFLYIKEHCKIRNIPDERSNVASVRYLDEDSLEIQRLDRKKLDKYHCEVDLDLEPQNLILSDGGKELGDVLHIYAKARASSSSSKKHKSASYGKYEKYADEIKMSKLFFKNLKYHFRGLLEGIYKLHQNNIIQRDIKIENIMIDWTSKSQNNVLVRYIDFGLSEILTTEYRSSKHNIHAQGTPELMPPDIIIASELKKYYRYDKEYLYGRIYSELEKSVKKTFIELHLDTSIIKPMSRELINRIHKAFNDGTMLDKYFGQSGDKFNGYVQKSDVYALGITLCEILHKYCRGDSSCSELKKNPKLSHLIKNMIDLDPEKRFNIIQCLQHPYFQ